MKATINAGENVRTKIGQIIGESMYVKWNGQELPEDFIIYATDSNGRKWGIKPVADYQEARDLVKKLNGQDEK